MRFINGLKSLSQKKLLLVILILFITSWVLILLGTTIIDIFGFVFIVRTFALVLTGFTFIIMMISFFIPIDKMGSTLLIITGLLTIPVMFLFFAFTGELLYQICRFANILFIAFFAYKWCMDNSKKFDNYLYKKNSKTFLRILEFSIFIALSMFILFITIRVFRILSVTIPPMEIAANIFRVIFLIDVILLLFVLLRLILVQKLSAYIPLFEFFTYFYVLYVVIDLFAEVIFAGAGVNSYEYISFAIDLIMFIYIVGSIFARVDYIKDTIKIFRVDTIALFVILVKMLVKLNEIMLDVTLPSDLAFQIAQAIIVLFYFGFFALFSGIYSIIRHKEGKKVE